MFDPENRAPIPDVAGQAVRERTRESIVAALDFQYLLVLGISATAEFTIHGILVQHVEERAESRDRRVAEVHHVQYRFRYALPAQARHV